MAISAPGSDALTKAAADFSEKKTLDEGFHQLEKEMSIHKQLYDFFAKVWQI